MSRSPFNVLVLPYRLTTGGGAYEYAVLHRADGGQWQFIAGGGEGAEDPEAAAQREALEEGGVSPDAVWMTLDSRASIPRSAFPGAPWPGDLFVIPEYAFAVDMRDADLQLSGEHDRHEWLDYETARLRLTWDSNRVALWELTERLNRPPDETS